MTIQKQIMRKHCHFTNVAIRIHEPSPPRIIIPAPQIVQPRFLIEHIPAIAERLHLAQRLRQFASAPQRRAPRIIAVADNSIAILIQNCNKVAGQGQYLLYEEAFPAFAGDFAASPSAACARSTGRDGLAIEYSYDCVDYY